MNYSDNPADVRVDFFKASGKWYTTECVRWTGKWHGSVKEGIVSENDCQSVYDGFKQSLRDHFKNTPNRLSEMDAICLEPYHEHAFPIQLKAGSWNKD